VTLWPTGAQEPTKRELAERYTISLSSVKRILKRKRGAWLRGQVVLIQGRFSPALCEKAGGPSGHDASMAVPKIASMVLTGALLVGEPRGKRGARSHVRWVARFGS
jgi:hypothetical protein